MKLCGVCIITNDVPRLAGFYKEVFCMQPEGDSIHSAFDSMQLAIWNPGNVSIAAIKNMSLMYFIDDADSEYKRVTQIAGIDSISQPVKQPWGVKSFSFRDPDGNEVYFIEKLNGAV